MHTQRSIHPSDLDTLARTRVTTAANSPAVQLGNAMLSVLWHSGKSLQRGACEFRFAQAVARERRALARLSEHELLDIGLDRATAQHEAARDFLDVPDARRCKQGALRPNSTSDMACPTKTFTRRTCVS